MKILTNREFAQADAAFAVACSKAGIERTKRQASKFRRGVGRAYTMMIRRGGKEND